MDKFNKDDWEFERSSGYGGERNKITGEWIRESEFRKRQSEHREELLWENEVFRIIKLHTLSNTLTEKIVDELKKKITIYVKN